MSDLELKVIFGLVIVLVAVAGGLPLLRREQELEETRLLLLGEAFAAGVFLGAGLIHMLGNASAEFGAAGVDYPWPMVICGAVLLFLLYLDHLGERLKAARGPTSKAMPLLATVMLSIHSFLVGGALGASSQIAMTIVIFVAVLAHKGAAAFALSVTLAKSTLARRQRLACLAVFIALFPIGLAVGSLLSLAGGADLLLEATFSAFAAATFLYLGTLHGLAASTLVARCGNQLDFSFVALGFGLMALVAIWT